MFKRAVLEVVASAVVSAVVRIIRRCQLFHISIARLGITALAVDNIKGYALVAVNDRRRHLHVVDLCNEVIVIDVVIVVAALHLR